MEQGGALRDRTEFRRSSRSRKISALPALLTLLLAASLVAQKTPKSTSPKYDLQTEATIKGTIEEVKLPPKGDTPFFGNDALVAGYDKWFGVRGHCIEVGLCCHKMSAES